jgi:biopolymer transport protein ExbD
MISATQIGRTQAMQEGISVELVPTSSAVSVPDADSQEALIITVTDTGRIYSGIVPLTPDTLADKFIARRSSYARPLYIKADARAPYASVVKVLDAAHLAGIAAVTLLTIQPSTTQAGKPAFPEGIEMELAPGSIPVAK